MRYMASEKLEIIQLVEQSNLSIRRSLSQIGVPKSTFYGWYRRYAEGGFDALEDQPRKPGKIWNKVPEETATLSLNWRSLNRRCHRESWQ